MAARDHPVSRDVCFADFRIRGDVFQEEMADYLGISQGHLSKIERGKGAPTIETLFLLSERFRKSIDWILRGEGN